ncbi:MAG: peptidyl-prolyl cis-trans isomerase [bacterium]|nr:peptidyl-prolyl cis-trans isomerase [bacterium]
MLRFFRRRMKAIMWVLVIAITVTFVFWGVTTRLSEPDDRPRIAGELFGRRVSLAEFDAVFAAVRANAFLNRMDLTEPRAREMVWGHLTLLEAARRAGISVSDREVARAVRAAFGPGDSFSQAAYETALRIAGVAPDLYEEWVRQRLMVDRLRALVSGGAWMTDAEIEAAFREARTASTIRYALAGIDEAERLVAVDEEEVRAHYEARRPAYARPAMVSVRYLLIPLEGRAGPPAVTDEEIEAFHRSHGDEFTHGERVRARHILIAVDAGAGERAERRAARRAERLLGRLRGGADFEALAARHSDDAATKAAGGDLGLIERTDVPPAVAEAAFSLGDGEIGGPVRSERGLHILTVEGREGPGVRPLGEVAGIIRGRLEREKRDAAAAAAGGAAYSRAVEVALALVGGRTAEELAREQSLDLLEAGPFPEHAPPDGTGAEFARAAFRTEPGSFSDIVEIPGRGYAIILPRERIAESIPPLDDVREAVEREVRRAKAVGRAREIASGRREEIERRMRETGDDFEEAARRLRIETREAGPVGGDGLVPGMGREPAVGREAHHLAPGDISPVIDTAAGACFFVVTRREEPDGEALEREAARFGERALRDRQLELLEEWARSIEAQASLVDFLDARRAGG